MRRAGGASRLSPPWFAVTDVNGGFADLLIQVTSNVSVRSYQQWGPSFADDSLMTYESNGIISAQNAAIQETLDLEACILRLCCGKIVANGETYKTTHRASSGDQPGLSIGTFHDPQTQGYKPENRFPSISISTHVQHSGENLILLQRILTTQLFPLWNQAL